MAIKLSMRVSFWKCSLRRKIHLYDFVWSLNKGKIQTKPSISFHTFFLKILIGLCCPRHWCWSSELRFIDNCFRLSWSEIWKTLLVEWHCECLYCDFQSGIFSGSRLPLSNKLLRLVNPLFVLTYILFLWKQLFQVYFIWMSEGIKTG